jgi:hypothetical protein
LIELVDFAPGFVGYRAGYVDFQFYCWHRVKIFTTGDTEDTG